MLGTPWVPLMTIGRVSALWTAYGRLFGNLIFCILPDLDTCFRWCKEPERPRTRGLYPCIKSNKLIDWHQIAQPPLPSPSANKLGLFELFVAFPLEHPGFSNKGDCDAALGQVDESSATQICWLVLCGKNFQPVLGGWFSSSLQPLLPPEEKSTSALLSRPFIFVPGKGGCDSNTAYLRPRSDR